MKTLTLNEFKTLLESSIVKPKLKRDLRFTTSTEHLSDEDWANSELLAIRDKSGNNGVLILELGSGTYLLPYELQKLSSSSTTGRPAAIICDLCMTWQSGTRAGSIVFTQARNSTTNVGFLCCLDLQCSMHVRTKTAASKVSRAQLREDMDNAMRVARMEKRLESLVTSLGSVNIT
jgi:hypothetical protein